MIDHEPPRDGWRKIEPGSCDGIIITAARVVEMGHGEPLAPYLYILMPRNAAGEAIATCWVQTQERLRELVQATAPRTLYTRTCGANVDIDCDELIRLCRARTLH